MRISQVAAALALSFLSSGSQGFSMSSSTVSSAPSWADIQASVGKTEVGQALDKENKLRSTGQGSAHVQNKLRLFDSKDTSPAITLFRDQAGWCPYCQKTMLLIEEKKVPIKIELVPMRSYGDKPEAFLRKVPSGLLPAIEVNGKIITESSVIMELLDRYHSPEDGYLPMMPAEDDEEGNRKYQRLARLERELFSWWCTVLFRPEMPGGGMLSGLLGGGGMSGAMQGFMDCLSKVDVALTVTKGPWFFDHDYPTMIDFVFVSHVERMLASCAYWKGLNIRDPKWNLPGINAWLDAFEKRGTYVNVSYLKRVAQQASFFVSRV
jgi:glutathione S-transferase